MSEKNQEIRLRCPTCLAVFRTDFECCPADGAALAPCESRVDPLIGAEIAGRYVIEERAGEGSMGLIYRARHVRLPRRFAIKVLFGDLVVDPRMRIRFAQEASLASRLSHPYVVSVVDFGRSDAGLLYLVMNYVEGETLGELIAREAPLDTAQAIRLTRQLAQGLGHAHEHGLVHRDFKPGNVLLERQEIGPPVPRILDFGLAISMNDREEAAGEDVAGRLTECGLIVGTPIYIAPEQAMDMAVDHRADLFALGVVMYEMLAGKPPFDGRPVEIAHKNVAEAVPPISRRSPGVAVPPELEQVVHRLLAKAPGARFQSAAELCAALDAVEHHTVDARTQSMRPLIAEPSDRDDGLDELDDETWLRRPRRRRLALAGAFLFAAGAVAYGLADRSGLIGATPLEPTVTAASAAAEPGLPPLAAAKPVPTAEPSDSGPGAPPATASAEAFSPGGAAGPSAATTEVAVMTTGEAGAPPAPTASPVKAAPARAARSLRDRRIGRFSPRGARRPARPLDDVQMRQARLPEAAMPGAAMIDDSASERTGRPPADADAGVNQLVRIYRQVGESLDVLEARGGDRAARRFRERYFRLPYGDALRLPAVRTDTLRELTGLRAEVKDAIDSIPFDADAGSR